MKKSLVFFLVGLVAAFFIGFNFVKAETTDTEAPVLNSFDFVDKEFVGGEQIRLSADIIDDVSGFQDMHIIFIEENETTFKNDNNYQVGFQKAIMSNGYMTTYTTKVEKDTIYKIYSINVSDKVNNNSCYTSYQNNDSGVKGCTKSFDEFKIKVKGSNTIPRLTNITINKKEFDLGEEAEFTIELNNIMDVTTVVLNYHHENIHNEIGNIDMFRVGDSNLYKGKLKLKYVGNYYFSTASVIFTHGGSDCETYAYQDKELGSSCTLYNSIENSKYDFKVKGEIIKDTELPSFVSMEVLTPKFQAPGFLKLRVKTTDNIEVKDVSVVYGLASDFDKINFPTYGGMCQKIETNLFECTNEFNQYSKPGIYKIRQVLVADTSGNMTFNYYGKIGDWIEYDKVEQNGNAFSAYRKIPEYTFEVEKNVNSDATSSTISNDLLDKIKNSKDDAVISIDCTNDTVVKKEVFDSIKGTNKTISIETNGIQWIFRGKDILNNTKDINVKSNISIVDTSTDRILLNKIFDKISIINISFNSNGLLPGIAKIRVKADYTFRNVIGTKNLFVFYLDESNGMIRYISKTLNMTKDGYYEFYIEHNSKYIISNTKPNQEYVNTSSIDQKIENLNNSTTVKDNISTNDTSIEDMIDNNKETIEKENDKIDKELNIDNKVDIVEDEIEKEDKENNNPNPEDTTNNNDDKKDNENNNNDNKEENEDNKENDNNQENNDDNSSNDNKKEDNNTKENNNIKNTTTFLIVISFLIIISIIGVVIYKKKKINVKNT